MTGWDLPESVTIGGVDYPVNADYRDILQIISVLGDPEMPEPTRLYVALDLFLADMDALPDSDYDAALRQMMVFINCGEEEVDQSPRPKTIDWEQDRQMIIADVNKTAGTEIRALPFLHWWTFIAFFSAIGEGRLSAVVGIREKLRKGKKLDDWERDFYRQNRKTVDFRIKYTDSENEMLRELLGG